ncbi:MAG: TssQ family T6SS-associated lipoprotein [Betaproteobacteria bacterium]|nr:TssQ family T6SS-associated lipoprotein [Betaproteobacteria bacterium]
MLTLRLTLLLILATTLAAGCQSGLFKNFGATRNAGNSYLEEGVQNYEEGNYRVAKRRLQFALEEGLSRPDRVKAHKYLAFIACVSSQQLTCREEFTIALELDPKFELAPAEAGHPIWGPMFKSVKAKQARQP